MAVAVVLKNGLKAFSRLEVPRQQTLEDKINKPKTLFNAFYKALILILCKSFLCSHREGGGFVHPGHARRDLSPLCVVFFGLVSR